MIITICSVVGMSVLGSVSGNVMSKKNQQINNEEPEIPIGKILKSNIYINPDLKNIINNIEFEILNLRNKDKNKLRVYFKSDNVYEKFIENVMRNGIFKDLNSQLESKYSWVIKEINNKYIELNK